MTALAYKAYIKEIGRVVEHLLDNWMPMQFDKLAQYFHKHVVMIEPGTNERLRGVPEIIENYRDFLEGAEIFSYSVTELLVDLFEETAIAHFTYRVKYDVENTKYDESNTEILVFQKHKQHWQIVWRAQILGQ